MATITVVDEKTIKIAVGLEDALTMIAEAENNVSRYAEEILAIAEKMPEFQFTYFCFYAYDTNLLFEKMLGIDPKQYLSFSLDAPDSFFYALYGGMKALSGAASRYLEQVKEERRSKDQVVELDVRPQLLSGQEPFSIIMETFQSLRPDETFVLHAIMKPAPLIPMLESKGYESDCRQLTDDHWVVTFSPRH